MNAPYVADKRLYLNKEGEVVDEKSADRVELLVAKGGTLSYDVAASHGLVQGDRDTQTEPVKPNDELATAQARIEELEGYLDAADSDINRLREQRTALEPLAAENEKLNKQIDDLKNDHSAAADKAASDLAEALANNKKLTARVSELEGKLKAVKPGDNKAITEAPETK